MKALEWFGVFFAAVGFALLSLGYLAAGFVLGGISTGLLIPYFGITRQHGLFMLQLYFSVFNLIGLVRAFA